MKIFKVFSSSIGGKRKYKLILNDKVVLDSYNLHKIMERIECEFIDEKIEDERKEIN